MSSMAKRYESLLKRAFSGKSRSAAIRAHCLWCQGWDLAGCRECRATGCPLFAYGGFGREGAVARPSAPEAWRGFLERVAGGKSPKDAIRAMCGECFGWDGTASQIRDCTCLQCPLRPYRGVAAPGKSKPGADGRGRRRAERVGGRFVRREVGVSGQILDDHGGTPS